MRKDGEMERAAWKVGLGVEEKLSVLAQDFLQEWKHAHGAPNGTANPLIGRDSLAVHIEHAFTKAELNLAEQPAGRHLVVQYAEGLLDQVCSHMVGRVEETLDRRVVSTGVSLNPAAGWLMCFYKFDDPL
jgi:hypothetical protein